MKENADKHLDDLSRKIIGKSSIVKPSFDFTQSVMSQVKAISKTTLTTYKPLISKSMWLFITSLASTGIIYIIFGPQSESLWLQKLKFDQFFSPSSLVPNFEISQTTLYVVVLFAVMFSIQIPLLKRQLDKRFE